jgi:hypothetical protein
LKISDYASWFNFSRLAHGSSSFVASWRKGAHEGEGSGYHGAYGILFASATFFIAIATEIGKKVDVASALNNFSF